MTVPVGGINPLRLVAVGLALPIWRSLKVLFAFDLHRKLKELAETPPQIGRYICDQPPSVHTTITLFQIAVKQGRDLVRLW